jgi:hypothetical protein
MDFIRSAEFLTAINEYVEVHTEFQAAVYYDTQDQLLSLLDELD